jgi:glucokinase
MRENVKAQFVADVGGTNIRLAQFENGNIVKIKKYLCSEYATIGEVVLLYFSDFPDTHFVAGCIAIAGPVSGDTIVMTNHSWQFSIQVLQQQIGVETLHVINDFTAVAYCLPQLHPQQKLQIGGGKPLDKGNMVVFGPGTGLGVEHLFWRNNQWHILEGEGGHVDFAPVDENDLIVWRFLSKHLGRVSAEDLLCGQGIVNIYRALCEANAQSAILQTPAEISQKGVEGSCLQSQQTMQLFCNVLGSMAGNLALNAYATGGVYIGGGIVPRFADFLLHSDFRARFETKGKMTHYVQPIPTYLITAPDHALLGAAFYLTQVLQH